MGEVVISTKTSVLVHGDTVSYRVDSFITDPLANTEDVLKRLPGVEVSRDGKISIQGKEVNKIFINGKEYFADDIRTVLQNLPAEVIEKIQVADWRDEDAQFTGNKESTTEKVINLQMKKKYNGGIYGRAGAGYGTRDRYQAGLFANYMNEGAFRLTVSGNVSNNGIADVSNDNSSVNNTSWRTPGVREEQRGNFNFSYDKNKKFQLNGSYSVSNNDNYLLRSSQRTTYLPSVNGDSLLRQEDNNEQNSGGVQHSIRARSKYRFSEKSSLRTTTSVRYSDRETINDGLNKTFEANSDAINFQRETTSGNNRKSFSADLNNTYMQQFEKKGRTLMLTLNAGIDDNNGTGNNDNVNIYTSPVLQNVVRNRTADNGSSIDTRAGFNYTEPIGEYNSIALNYYYSYSDSRSDRDVEVANNGTYITDTNQSRGYRNINNNHKAGLTYQYSKESLTAGLGIDAEPYSRKSLQTSGPGNDVEQKGINYFPRVFGRYNFSKKTVLDVNYNGGITPPSISQLQPIPDFTDSLNIFTGNPQLRPEVRNNIRLRYSKNNPVKGRSMWVSLRTDWVNSKIINNTQITGSKRTTTPVNADGNFTLAGEIQYTEPVVKKLLTTSVSFSSGWSNNISFVNGQLQEVSNYTVAPRLRINSYSGKWYEGSLSYNYRWNKVAGGAQNNNLLQSHDLTHDGTFILPKRFRASYYISYMVNKGLSQDFQQQFFLTNIMLDKTFEKPKGLSLRVQAFDVFNNYPTVQRNVGDNYFEDIEVNRIGSYIMFSVIYKFTSFPEKKEKGDDEE